MEIGNCTTDLVQIQAAIDSTCIKGNYCPVVNCMVNNTTPGFVAVYYPFCPPGSVCSDPTSLNTCPKHYFCTEGTVNPLYCTFPQLTCASKGHSIPNNGLMVSGVLAFGGSIVFLFIVIYLLLYGYKMLKGLRKQWQWLRFMNPKEIAIAKEVAKQEADSSSVIESLALMSTKYKHTSEGWKAVKSALHHGAFKQNKNSWVSLVEEVNNKRAVYDKKDEETGSHKGPNPIHSEGHDIESKHDQHHTTTTAHPHSNTEFKFKTIEHPIQIRFKELSMNLIGSHAPILKDVNGSIRSQRITGLMGPSGSGKTSLLALLRGQTYYATTGGTLMVNNRIYDNLIPFKDVTSYVPQDDIMYDELTVEENLKFAAVLFNKRGYKTITEVTPMVKHALELLSMNHIAQSIVGSPLRKGISGGQKKRVSIGMEMMKEASLFLLDEPTSGLDSASSISLLNALHNLTTIGVTIVSTIHQPRLEILRLIDDLILLAPGGRLVYYGPTSEVEKYFCHSLHYTMLPGMNVADYVMDVMAGFVPKDGAPNKMAVSEIINDICDTWKIVGSENMENLSPRSQLFMRLGTVEAPTSLTALDTDKKRIIDYIQDFFKILCIVVYRQLAIFYRSITTFKMDTLTLWIIGLLISLTYPTIVLQTPTSTFNAQISSMQLTFTQLVAPPGLRLLSNDALMRNRESESGLQLAPYFIGKYLSSAIDIIIYPLCFLCTFYPLAVPSAPFTEYYVLLMILQLATYSFTNVISVFVPADNRTLIINGILVMLWAFGGIMTTEATSRMGGLFSFMKFISPFRFSFRYNVFMEYRTYSPAVIEKTLLPQLKSFDYGDYATAEEFLNIADKRISEDTYNLVIYSIVTNVVALLYILYAKDHYAMYHQIKRYILECLKACIAIQNESRELVMKQIRRVSLGGGSLRHANSSQQTVGRTESASTTKDVPTTTTTATPGSSYYQQPHKDSVDTLNSSPNSRIEPSNVTPSTTTTTSHKDSTTLPRPALSTIVTDATNTTPPTTTTTTTAVPATTGSPNKGSPSKTAMTAFNLPLDQLKKI